MTSNLLPKISFIITLTITLMSHQSVSWAHGGVSVDQDVCIMQIGKLKAHFTGYQPEYRATQEFCEDIPVVGKSIFVIDFISDNLRSMELDFRVIEDVNEIGNKAVLSDLGGPEAIEKATVYYKEKAIYPRGTLNSEFEFKNKGRFIGIVTAHYSGDENHVVTSVFPFQVGIFNYWNVLGPIILIILISSAVFGIFLGRLREQNKQK